MDSMDVDPGGCGQVPKIWSRGDIIVNVRPKFLLDMSITCRVQSPSEIGPRTDPFSAVRRRPVEADQTSPAVPSRLRRRHSNLTASVSRVTSTPSLTECPPASMKCPLGCGPTGCR